MLDSIFSALKILVVFVVITMGLLYFLQSKLLYAPDREYVTTPSKHGIDYREVTLETEDGEEIVGWYLTDENPRGALLFCHGNAGNISYRMDMLKAFVNLDFSIFIFDYRGYGKSSGSPSEKGTYSDSKAAWNFVRKKFDRDSIIIFGRSLGGAIASHLAKKVDPQLLILESPFTSFPEIAQEVFPFLPVKPLAKFSYNNIENIKNTDSPILILHSKNDDLIPYSHGKRVFRAAPQPKEFVTLTSETHNKVFTQAKEKYFDHMSEFIAKYYSS